MNSEKIKELVEKIKGGLLDTEAAVSLISSLPYEDLGDVKIDHHRGIRKGFPEVVYAPGKEPARTAEIARKIFDRSGRVLITRVSQELYEEISSLLPPHLYNRKGRVVSAGTPLEPRADKPVPVLTGGTADIPVAEEAAAVLEMMGCGVTRVYDVGVAGVHRLIGSLEGVKGSRVVIAVAGMDGALASVAGGLCRQPVIAVPTSAGYGASFGGVGPLLTMLSSCAPGVVVSNIDNGFGAGYTAALINRQ